MAYNYFGAWLLLRLMLLSLVIAGYVYSVMFAGWLGAIVLLIVAAQIYELWHFLQRTNREVARFLASARYADFSQNFEFDNLGSGFRSLGETFTDILSRLKEQRLSQEVELRQLRAMVDHMPVPLLGLHDDGHLKLLNNAARRFFARNQVTRNIDLGKFGDDFWKQIENCKPGEKRLATITMDGIESQVTLALTTITSDTGVLRLISLQDIGQELALAQLNAWQDLVRVLTHEIMNSITPVASLAQTTADMANDVCRELAETDPVRVPLDRICDAARTVARRAGNLMQFVANYRQLAGLPEPAKRRINVLELLSHIGRISTVNNRAPKITLDVDVVPSGLELFVDPEQIEQVLINLLRNAEQALAGREDGSITLRAFLNPRGQVTLEVRDNGPGIDEKILHQIFVPYFTTKPEGSGIGLALARQIVMTHGGSIRADNAPDGGAVFTLTFV
jgi:two-component system, NtrC family, nitrogen regulation sensor histidine kinase NtrY